MRTALVALIVFTGCSRTAPPPEAPPRPCTASGPLDAIAFLDSGAPVPPGWTTVEVDVQHPIACLLLIHDRLAREELTDAGQMARYFEEDPPALALDHPALGSKVRVALRGNAWKYQVWWDGSSESFGTTELVGLPGGSRHFVPPTRTAAMGMDMPPPPDGYRDY